MYRCAGTVGLFMDWVSIHSSAEPSPYDHESMSYHKDHCAAVLRMQGMLPQDSTNCNGQSIEFCFAV